MLRSSSAPKSRAGFGRITSEHSDAVASGITGFYIFAGTGRRDPKNLGSHRRPQIVFDRRGTSILIPEPHEGLGDNTGPDSERTPEEQYNMSVEGYIYAASKERDLPPLAARTTHR